MYSATEQFADFSKSNVTQASKIASLAIENAEKLLTLNMNAAKMVLATGVEGAKAAASVKDVQDLLVLRTKYAETGVETATAYTRSLYEISSQAQAQFSALAEEVWSAYTKDTAAGSRRPARMRRPARNPRSTRSRPRSLLRPPRSTSFTARRSKS
jgi:phasin family protein